MNYVYLKSLINYHQHIYTTLEYIQSINDMYVYNTSYIYSYIYVIPLYITPPPPLLTSLYQEYD